MRSLTWDPRAETLAHMKQIGNNEQYLSEIHGFTETTTHRCYILQTSQTTALVLSPELLKHRFLKTTSLICTCFSIFALSCDKYGINIKGKKWSVAMALTGNGSTDRGRVAAVGIKKAA